MMNTTTYVITRFSSDCVTPTPCSPEVRSGFRVGGMDKHILILNNLTCHITGVNGSTTLYEIPAYLSHAQGNKKEGMSKWVTQWIGSRPVYMHDILHYSMQKREFISHYNQANAHTITYHHFQSGHVSDIIWGGSKNKANSHMGIPSEKNKWSTTHKSHLYTFLLLQRSSCRDSTSIVFFFCRLRHIILLEVYLHIFFVHDELC